ncbi:hypothetical protein C4D60_Mb08t20490 [Musa balbisiana]|uniref:Uncharacterized protein n=1 Tax=Musa balbisiana TaxID=52838 RepID=A0A4S8K573_MUSBA|nr:hypothetical protein C4D60_Mb08t20490 [Musa balbisiana]
MAMPPTSVIIGPQSARLSSSNNGMCRNKQTPRDLDNGPLARQANPESVTKGQPRRHKAISELKAQNAPTARSVTLLHQDKSREDKPLACFANSMAPTSPTPFLLLKEMFLSFRQQMEMAHKPASVTSGGSTPWGSSSSSIRLRWALRFRDSRSGQDRAMRSRAGSSDEVEVGVGDGRGGLEGGEIGEAGKESGEVMGVEDAEGGTGEGLDAAPPPADAGAGLAVPPTDDAPQHQPQLVVAESLHHPRLLLNTSHKAEQVTIKWRLKLTRVKFNEHRPEKTSPIIAQIIVENPMYSSS